MIAWRTKWMDFSHRMDAGLERFVNHHPVLGCLGILCGMPLMLLATVGLFTIVLALPLGWLLGCL